MSRRFWIAGLVVLGLIALYWLSIVWFLPSIEIRRARAEKYRRLSSAPAPIPQTIYLKNSLVSGAGFVMLTGETTQATRSDGSTASMTRDYDVKGNVAASRRRVNLTDGITADISDQARAITEMKVPNADEARVLARFTPNSQCKLRLGNYDNHSPPLRRETLLGYETVVFESSTRDSTTTVWLAPQLGCAELVREEVLVTASGLANDKVRSRPRRYSRVSQIICSSRFLRTMLACLSAKNFNEI